jgi:uncharacterized protein
VATPEPPSLIEYPSLFPIKVMGANQPGFEQAMVDVTATSREQLDALYRSLSSHPLVKVVL